ncbi:hypothetical protein C2S51_032233 [Perilla frutescens var. frutescens]|nr:hypothetical protein C2S51_032233 [Perilla frutescens var. frutescens]
MEFELSSFLFLLSSFIFIFILSKMSKPKLNLPPGPRKLPLIGNLHLLGGSDPLYRVLKDLANKYGPLMHLQLGEVSCLIVSSPETAEKFMKTHDTIFANRPSLLVSEIGCYGNSDIAFAPYGEYWKQLRRICTLELLGAKRVQSFRPIREEEVLNLCKWIGERAESTISLTEKLSSTNLDIMVRAAFGKKRDEQAALIDIMKQSPDFLSEFCIVDVYPSLKFLRLLTGMKKKIEKQCKLMDEVAEKIIVQRKQSNSASWKTNAYEGDLLDALLKLESDKSLENIPLTTENIKAVFVDMFGAGIEQSSTVIDWAMAEMLKNPSVMEKAQNEVRKVFDGKNKIVNECFFDELHYLKLVIKETLRLHPPAPLLVPRESREQCEINGYVIPSKTRVMVNAWAIGRDPKYWDEAERFKPERFLRKPVDFKASSLDFIPFGGGRRICPGMTFAMAGIELQLAMFLYHFDWILPNGMKPEELDMTEYLGISYRRKNGLNVIPLVTRSLPV